MELYFSYLWMLKLLAYQKSHLNCMTEKKRIHFNIIICTLHFNMNRGYFKYELMKYKLQIYS